MVLSLLLHLGIIYLVLRIHVIAVTESVGDIIVALGEHVDYSLGSDHAAALSHENQYHSHGKFAMSCFHYGSFMSILNEVNGQISPHEYHPIYISRKSNRVCLALSLDSDESKSKLKALGIMELLSIPHTIKFHRETHISVVEILKNKGLNDLYLLEVTLGLGLRKKTATLLSSTQSDFESTLKVDLQIILDDDAALQKHWRQFFWTSNAYKGSTHSAWSAVHNLSFSHCQFQQMHVERIGSTSASMLLTAGPSECLLLVASVAAVRPEVSRVGFHSRQTASTEPTAAAYAEEVVSYAYGAPSATDQNAWIQSGTTTKTPYSDVGLDGEGYVLGLIDTGLDDMSCFFVDYSGTKTPRTTRGGYKTPVTEMWRRKVVQYVAWADELAMVNRDHGTWCAGAALGDILNAKNSSHAQYNGVAPAAKLAMFDVDHNHINDGNWLNVPSLYDVALPPSYNIGARVHSNSWGTTYLSFYTSKAIDVDEFMAHHPDFLFVVAAGNSGSEGLQSVISPGVTKSGLTVGATARDHSKVVYFSGRGYTYDGRIKPDVVAPGTYLLSAGSYNATRAGSSCTLSYSSGTSMATPIVAGAALLAKQYLENASYWGALCNISYRSCPVVSKFESGFVSGALLKAVLVHSAYTLVPDDDEEYNVDSREAQGWGQVRLVDVLPLPEHGWDFDLYIADQEVISSLRRRIYRVAVLDEAVALKVTIAWNDIPNVYWSAKNLLNDLDLRVVSPSGIVFYGNDVRGDELNPLEKVVVNSSETGEYQVEVTAKVLVDSEQAYSIVITSGGYVKESELAEFAVSLADLDWEAEHASCVEQGGSRVYLPLQLEDWAAGQSWWAGTSLSVRTTNSSATAVDYSCTFADSSALGISDVSRTSQCPLCLHDNATYEVRLHSSASPVIQGNDTVDPLRLVRVSSPMCNLYLTSWKAAASLTLAKGECNRCSKGHTLLQVIMTANVTDDDVADYSWGGLAYWNATSISSGRGAAGSLILGDRTAERHCLVDGEYVLAVFDAALFSARGKHAEVAFPACNVTLLGSAQNESTRVFLYEGGCYLHPPVKSSSSEYVPQVLGKASNFLLLTSVALIAGLALSVSLCQLRFKSGPVVGSDRGRTMDSSGQGILLGKMEQSSGMEMDVT